MSKTILVIYGGNRPSAIVTDADETYDIEYSKTYECYFSDMSGVGRCGRELYEIWPPDADYWLADDAELQVVGGRRRFARSQFSKPIEDWSQGSDCVWCSVCNDWLPTEDSYGLCDHISWCDGCGWWVTPDDEPCGHDRD
jgi:hypothetical protein